jgi:hypothetical protein
MQLLKTVLRKKAYRVTVGLLDILFFVIWKPLNEMIWIN